MKPSAMRANSVYITSFMGIIIVGSIFRRLYEWRHTDTKYGIDKDDYVTATTYLSLIPVVNTLGIVFVIVWNLCIILFEYTAYYIIQGMRRLRRVMSRIL